MAPTLKPPRIVTIGQLLGQLLDAGFRFRFRDGAIDTPAPRGK